MKNQRPKVAPIVALDIGDVCVKIHPEECAKELGFNSLEEISQRKPEVFSLALELETGKMSSSHFLNELAKYIEIKFSVEDLEKTWNSLIGEEIRGMEEIIEQIFAMDMTPVFFSNISDIHYTYVLKKLSFANKISRSVLSYVVGEVKPNSLIYEVMEREHCEGGVPVLYLDDRPENIEAGKARGWNSYQVGTIGGIHERLAELKDPSLVCDRNFPI